jgi:hypothetical protein
MTEWTDSAKRALDNYFGRMRSQLHASGADAGEVIDDLGRHIDQEIAAANLRVVTEQDVQQMLQRIGAPEAPGGKQSVLVEERPHATAPTPRKVHPFLLFFGVLLPAITLAVEVATHMCAGVFFDPIPTWWHVILVASVIAANLAAWLALRHGTRYWHATMFLNGVAVTVSLYFGLLFLQLFRLALIAIIIFGLGLVPLAPLFCFATALVVRTKLRRLAPDYSPRFWWGVGAGALAISLIAIPAPFTRHLASIAQSEDPEISTRAVRWLRAVGSKDTLLRDCYGGTAWSQDPVLGFSFIGTPIATEHARSLYFRVTGKPFNSVPAPQRNFARGGWGELNDWTWDREQGGDAVGAVVKGVTMSQSRLDGLIDGDAGWAYTEWILEFKNVSQRAREARAQIALPPGGVVSRLTLWVNGEEREAAFAGKEHVRQAYREVAVVQRRDPVLVTSCGPDRVLMQCFPVPAEGGTIKVRLGITAPLTIENATEASYSLPYFLERNFAVPRGSDHSLWIESNQPLIAGNENLAVDTPGSSRYGAHGGIADAQLASSRLRVKRNPDAARFWVADHGANDGSAIVQTLVQRAASAPKHIVLVVDTSESMQGHVDQVAAALAEFPTSSLLSLVLARDGVVDELQRSSDPTAAADILRDLRPGGGHDNVAALARAWDLAGADGVVVWIHGAQPVLLGNLEALQQRVFWKATGDSTAQPVVYDLQAGLGPNRIVEKLDSAWVAFSTVPYSGKVADDLRSLFLRWSAGRTFEWTRERVPSPDGLSATEKGSKHLARLWAFNEAKRFIAARQVGHAIKLGGTYQLVTPVTGAVVLESRQQFDQAGLTPVDSQSVPTVPEPGTLLLAATGVALLYIVRRRQKSSRA